MKWIAGWNLPGCLPEMEPQEFAADQYATARAFLADELRYLADSVESDDLSAEYAEIAASVSAQTSSFSITAPDGYVYWIENWEGK